MKIILFLFMIGILLISCGDKEGPAVVDEKNKYNFDTTDVQTTAAENPNESFLLSYNFEKGQKYNYRLTTISETNQTVEADTIIKQTVKQNIIYLVNLSLTEKDDDGFMDLNCTFTSVKLEADANNSKFSYESSSTTDSVEKDKYAEYEALINNPFSIRINRAGELLEIGKTDKIVNSYITIKGYADSVNTEQKTILKRDLGDGILKPIIVQLIRKMPDNRMAKDSSWSNVQPVSKFMVYDVINTTLYKIANLEILKDNKLAVIDAGLKTDVSGNNNFEDRGIKYEFKKPVTTATGKIYFNIDRGCLQKSKTKTIIDVFYTMEMMTPQGLQKGIRKEIISNSNIVELL